MAKTELKLYDNTRISDFKRCPRRYYYRHMRHWIPQGKSLPLIFGGAWHVAMEILWEMACRDPLPGRAEIIEAAYRGFLDEWEANGMPSPQDIDYEMEKDLAPRTPGNALEKLVAYLDRRWDAFERGQFELLYVEKSFAVPLAPDDAHLFYIGKIDKIVRNRQRQNKVLGIEHKTTTAYRKSETVKFRSTFLESFSPNSQVDGYQYALHMMYPGEVSGVWVDATLVHKTEEDFHFIPVERRPEQLDMWIWETRSWIDQIEANKAAAAEASASDRYMAAFPKNTNSCFDFNTACPYIDLCKSWANPVGQPQPVTLDEEIWDPLDRVDVSGIPELAGVLDA